MGEFASRGVANTALGFGIGGATLGLANAMAGCGCGNGGFLSGLFGNNNGCNVNRFELELSMSNAAKDARIGLLESQVYTDQKLTDVVKDYTAQINALAAEVRANKDEQTAVNMQQVAYNATTSATLACIQNQLAAITKTVVPNTAVCPGWGNVTITPATTTTTTPAA